MLKIYNTLTKKKQAFKPQDTKTVKMYTCGVTVYDDCHIGHARSLYIFDVIQRYLRYKGKEEGFGVKFVRNITDVDDKIINKAKSLAPEKSIPLTQAFDEVRNTYIERYQQDLARLGIGPADAEPLATENIPVMVDFIRRLIDKGFAYAVEGSVYFSVRKFTAYGKLSGKKIDDLYSSVRIDNDPLKRDPLDFALWKKAAEGEPFWDSPWGRGRPGWHIECSVMSQKYLGTDTLDIHGGGRDLVFPHHENELAQSEALTGKPFANYWIHHGLITINSQKMAKSLGNFVSIKDFVDKYRDPNILKFFFLSAHYRSSIDYTEDIIEEAKKTNDKLFEMLNKVQNIFEKFNLEQIKEIKSYALKDTRFESALGQFEAAMDDDFNLPVVLAVLRELIIRTNIVIVEYAQLRNNKVSLAQLYCNYYVSLPKIAKVLGLNLDVPSRKREFLIQTKQKTITSDAMIVDNGIEREILQRLEYRKNKKFKEADKIRKELEKKGIILKDTKEGTVWRRKA